MAVHDDVAVVGSRVQEAVANPQQIVERLLGERHTGPDAGMDEEIAADLVIVIERAQEGAVGAGQRRREI